jgi:hypothetical protein
VAGEADKAGESKVEGISHQAVIGSFARRKYVDADVEDWPEGQVAG